MILLSRPTVLLTRLVRVLMTVATVVVSVIMWAPSTTSDIGDRYEAVRLEVPIHHGSASGEEPDIPRQAWACAVVCTGAETGFPDVLGSPRLKEIVPVTSPSHGRMERGRTLDPALRPPIFEAFS